MNKKTEKGKGWCEEEEEENEEGRLTRRDQRHDSCLFCVSCGGEAENRRRRRHICGGLDSCVYVCAE